MPVPGHSPLTMSALRDLGVVTVFVWVSVLLVHGLHLPAALAEWNHFHPQWAVDEVTLISVSVVAALGVFSWRRWRESLRVIARHEATLRRLHVTEDQVALKDQLIGSVSHELRTPLTVLLGYAQLLANGETAAAERKAMVDGIVSEGWDLAHIVEDLLTRAQTQSHSLTVAKVPVLLYDQAAQVVEALNQTERTRVTHTRADPVVAIADPARVRQIIRNLVSNALRYGGPQISIETAERSGTAYLAVIDNGPGVAASQRDLIFNPYHRVPDGERVPGSIGLGLSIGRELARLMSGDLTYQRRKGQSVFELSLPLAETSSTTAHSAPEHAVS